MEFDGRICTKHKDILMALCKLNATRNSLMLSDLMDIPDFYWDQPQLENVYLQTMQNMSMKRRVEVGDPLEKKN